MNRFSLSPESIFSWERGRLVRIEREARKICSSKKVEKGACFARCADETSAAPSVHLISGTEIELVPEVS